MEDEGVVVDKELVDGVLPLGDYCKEFPTMTMIGEEVVVELVW